MAFVPYVPPTQQRPISPQAHELANKIGALIEEYRGYYPDLSSRDVRDALRAAGTGGSESGNMRLLLVAALAAGIAVLVGGFFFSGTSGGEQPTLIMPLVVGAGIVATAIAFFVRNR